MLEKELAYKILKEAILYSPADETEIILQGGKSALTRFANNYIHQNVIQKDYYLTVKAILGKRMGVASCNVFEGTHLKEVVDAACEMAKHSKEDPDLLPVPEPVQYNEVSNTYFKSTIDFSPQDRADSIKKVINLCESKNFKAAGSFSNGDYMVSIMNSKNLFAYHSFTNAEFNLTVNTPENGTSWVEYSSNKVEEINIEELAKQAIIRAELNKNPITLDPGKYTVILEESAVISLLQFMCYLGFAGQDFIEDRSFMSGKIGQKIVGDQITIIDDAYREEVLGVPFDFEGIPKKPVVLIENGIARSVVYDRKTAHKAGVESTGHALPPPNPHGPLPINVIMLPGDSTVEEMIATTDYGVLVTRFWYDNVVNEKQAIITGMTRDGTFLIENGKITKTLKNMRYNESILTALSNVVSIGKTTKTFGQFGKKAVPALKINNFHFTGVSDEKLGGTT